MKLILLGTAGYHPNDCRQTACLMLPELGIVLDAGTAAYRVRDYLCTSSLDFYLTHAHLDHVVGLTYLLDIVRDRPVQRVTVHAAPATLAAVETHLLAEPLFPARLPCEFRALSEQTPLAGGGQLTHFPLEHPGGALGFRLDWPDRSLAYVTDTTARSDAAYVAAVRGVDLLVHECNFPDSLATLATKTGHSVTSAVADVAREAGVKRLVLIHIDPLADGDHPLDLDVANARFPATSLGHDRLEVEF